MICNLLISPSIYLDEPWRSEIPADRDLYLPEVPHGDAVEQYAKRENTRIVSNASWSKVLNWLTIFLSRFPVTRNPSNRMNS